MLLYHERTVALERRRRADLLIDVNKAMAGGKVAEAHQKYLLSD
ncbi:hypothetical protein [Phytopseudomonas daroniae]|nr:hypothetical protein [Pseudomonas daroniae]